MRSRFNALLYASFSWRETSWKNQGASLGHSNFCAAAVAFGAIDVDPAVCSQWQSPDAVELPCPAESALSDGLAWQPAASAFRCIRGRRAFLVGFLRNAGWHAVRWTRTPRRSSSRRCTHVVFERSVRLDAQLLQDAVIRPHRLFGLICAVGDQPQELDERELDSRRC